MKPKLISISGSVHAGKTTISRMLAAEMPNALYVDGDLISAWIGANYPKTATIDDMLPEIHKTIIEMVHPVLQSGLDVIIDYPFTDEVRREIIGALQDVEFEAKWFLLKPSMQKILKGSSSRPTLNDWEKERIVYHYAGPLVETTIAAVIDSTDLSPRETVLKVKENI
ncbi:MAG: AAA family ATPase [Candidatus Saccharimonas sp.]|nr:AAA family ATPase [Candidatus Saccharimonas sp.]